MLSHIHNEMYPAAVPLVVDQVGHSIVDLKHLMPHMIIPISKYHSQTFKPL